MLQILPQTSDNIIATKAIEKLTEEDYNRLMPLLQEKIDQHQKIRWYFEMDDFDGWEPKAMWKDLKFDAGHANDVEKVAMVGDKKWEQWLTQLMKPFTSAEIRYFELSRREEALNWIQL